MAAEDAAMQSMTSSLNLALNGTVYACKGTAYVLSHLFKLLMWLHLESKKQKEIAPGKRKLATMIAAGKKTVVVSITKEEYDKISAKNLAMKGTSIAEKYGIQYAAIDQTKTKDNDKDYVTMFIDANHMSQFKQMCTDYGFMSVTEHGTIESMPDKPHTPETMKDLFEDKEALSKYVDDPELHDQTAKFNVATFLNDEISKGNDIDGFINELSEPLIELCVANGYTIDMTGLEIKIPELEKAVERYLKGEPEPVTPADKAPEVMSTDTTRSSEKLTEPSKENDAEIENMDPPITETSLFEAEIADTVTDVTTDPGLNALDKLAEGSSLSSYGEKISEITEEAKSFDSGPDFEPELGPDVK